MRIRYASAIARTVLVIVIGAAACCATRPGSLPTAVPTGEWRYALTINGTPAGSSRYSNAIVGPHYRSIVEITMTLGDAVNTSRSEITETLDHVPVRLETSTTVVKNGAKHVSATTATFAGRTVTLTTDGKTSKYTLSRDFILEGNYIVAKLIEGRFRPGLAIETAIYDPGYELDMPIPVRVAVVGEARMRIGATEKRLIHITESIENVKNIDVYLDEHGVMEKTVIQMMNMTLELIRE